ncbi:hypothetical protein [Pseudomonas serbica]|uniref:hypothetical protein n=1 Tax=Pseudomonas serbica TaxID=2965074 RepID=UPI00237B63C8|nr:hypothetical protein [Pseudomonas serbica]
MNITADLIDPSADLTPEQDKLLGDLLNRALNAGKRLQYEPTAERFAQRFLEELNEDLGQLNQVYPAGGKQYEESYASMTFSWNLALMSCPAPLLDSQVMGRTLRTVFSEGGPFAPLIERTTFRYPPEKGKLYAAVYHLVMNEPERYQPWLAKISDPLAKIVMGLGDGFDAFAKELEGLKKTFGGETHIDALADITRKALEGMNYHPKTLREVGGVPALAGAGVDIFGLVTKLLETIRISAHAPQLFSESYHLIIEAIEFLHQTEFLNDEGRDYRLRDLAMTCFDELNRTRNEKWLDRDFWAKVLPDMAKTLPRENFNLRRMLDLIKYSDPDPQWLDEIKLADNFKPEYFKKQMTDNFKADELYNAVTKLRTLYVYSENERLQMLADRFSNDLGL